MTRKQNNQKLNEVLGQMRDTVSILTEKAPVNANTGREYKNGNRQILIEAAAIKGYASNEWATMKQWNAIHYNVAKREKGTLITYTVLQPSNGELVEVQQTAFVFNRCQLAGFQQAANRTV